MEEKKLSDSFKLKGSPDLAGQVIFSPDGKRIAAATMDTIILWDVTRKAVLYKFTQPGLDSSDPDLSSPSYKWKNSIRISFSRDGQYLASHGYDGLTRIWNLDKGELKHVLGEEGYSYGNPTPSIFSPDGRLVATMDDGQVFLWNAVTGDQLHSIIIGNPTGHMLLAFSPNGKYLALDSDHKEVALWNIASKRVEKTWYSCRRWRNEEGCEEEQVPGRDIARVREEDSENQELDEEDSEDEELNERDPDDEDLEEENDPKEDPTIWGGTFSSDGRYLAIGTDDGYVILWDYTKDEEIVIDAWPYSLDMDITATGVAFSPDGYSLAIRIGELLFIWSLEGNIPLLNSVPEESTELTSFSYSPNGELLAASMDNGTIKVYSTFTWESLFSLPLHKGGSYATAFSPDGKFLATGSCDNIVRLWPIPEYDARKMTEDDGDDSFIINEMKIPIQVTVNDRVDPLHRVDDIAIRVPPGSHVKIEIDPKNEKNIYLTTRTGKREVWAIRGKRQFRDDQNLKLLKLNTPFLHEVLLSVMRVY